MRRDEAMAQIGHPQHDPPFPTTMPVHRNQQIPVEAPKRLFGGSLQIDPTVQDSPHGERRGILHDDIPAKDAGAAPEDSVLDTGHLIRPQNPGYPVQFG